MTKIFNFDMFLSLYMIHIFVWIIFVFRNFEFVRARKKGGHLLWLVCNVNHYFLPFFYFLFI